MRTAPCFSTILFAVQLSFQTYIPGESPVHRLDARVKAILLLAYSLALFMLGSWKGMVAAVILYAVAHALSGIHVRRVVGLVKPVYILAVLVIVCNSFLLAGGGFALEFTLEGFERGVFFAARILLLVYASILLSFTTTATDLMSALAWFMWPLRKAGVPIDDVVMVLSIALRFIPIAAAEFFRVRNAQWSRGGGFDTGSVLGRLKAWVSVLAPMIVGMFRRADSLSLSLDARCYGAVKERGSLHDASMTAGSFVSLVAGLALCHVIAWFL